MFVSVFVAALALVSPDWRAAQCQGGQVAGRYINLAEGFSVRVPRAFAGRRGIQSSPERGVSIGLAAECEAFIVLYGEPNSLEWHSTRDAVDATVVHAKEADPRVKVSRHKAKLGAINADAATISSIDPDQIEEIVIAFRPGGEPVYTAILVSNKARYQKDRIVFDQMLRTFRLEPWR